ncbi:MAG: alginate lyase family protein, partial [Hymenobacter sp.]|nr:alginate lyase family protein [Hymenobacter sp.]
MHPGVWHKRSDLDRMKYMVQAGKDPWKTTFNLLRLDPKASYNYAVQKNPANNSLSRENPCDQCGQYESDARAAYLNALMWYLTGDQRHATKTIEILNAWANLTNFYGGGTEPLSAGIYASPLISAAEIIRYTNASWATADIDKFEAMLVYPGYSATTVPTAAIAADQVTFYWRIYNGDPGRFGNQDIAAWKSVMAMGVFLDNRVMYDRGLRYLRSQPHRPDDLPYQPGPPNSSFPTPNASSSAFQDEYTTSPNPGGPTPDYGGDGPINYYIYSNGQNQESSRDQSHGALGIGFLQEASEIAWNQGDDLYGTQNNRILSGLEFLSRYNVSMFKTYPDQPAPWVPTVASGEYVQPLARSRRWRPLQINPSDGGLEFLGPQWEMAVGHYAARLGLDPATSMRWTYRARAANFEHTGYETSGYKLDKIGWGGLTYHRPGLSPGDPAAFGSGTPQYRMNVLPDTIEAENFDYFVLGGEGKTYHDLSPTNTGGQYRPTEAVDL